jgi:hypothetical protein
VAPILHTPTKTTTKKARPFKGISTALRVAESNLHASAHELLNKAVNKHHQQRMRMTPKMPW